MVNQCVKIMYHKARDMLRKAKHPKHGSCETILERWYIDADYQKSLSDEGWTEEKLDNMTHLPWKTIPMKPDNDLIFVNRSTLIVDCTKNMLKKPDQEISQSIQHSKEGTILNNKLMITRNTPIRFTLALVGDIILQQIRLHPRSGSRTMNGGRHKVGIIGDLQPGLNSNFF